MNYYSPQCSQVCRFQALFKFSVLLLEDKEDQKVYTEMIMSFTNELHCILKCIGIYLRCCQKMVPFVSSVFIFYIVILMWGGDPAAVKGFCTYCMILRAQN